MKRYRKINFFIIVIFLFISSCFDKPDKYEKISETNFVDSIFQYVTADFFCAPVGSDAPTSKSEFYFERHSSRPFKIRQDTNQYLSYIHLLLDSTQIKFIHKYLTLNYKSLFQINNNYSDYYRGAIILKSNKSTDTLWIDKSGVTYFRDKRWKDEYLMNYINTIIPNNLIGGKFPAL
jgi:hypothetical protein